MNTFGGELWSICNLEGGGTIEGQIVSCKRSPAGIESGPWDSFNQTRIKVCQVRQPELI